jgi:EAL domain-containing protein (putative c-di-GMP-specific phosphodiesterase class I)
VTLPTRFLHCVLPEAERADHLLIAAPNRLTHERLSSALAGAMLSGAPVRAEESDLGLKVHCRQVPWPNLLEALTLGLSPMEKRDTRVAVIPEGADEITQRRACFASHSLEALLDQWHQLWLADLLAGNRIRIEVQPIVQYPPGRVHGYECLMRGIDQDGAVISPARVFQAAEKLGLVTALEARCRSAALRKAGEVYRRVADENLNFFVNFVPSAVNDAMATLRKTVAEVEAAGLRPGQVTFEVVETDKVDDTRGLMNILKCFRKAGFKVALDDVGAGYASLLSISTLRPDYIKLDGELVRRAAHSSLERKLVADLSETGRQNGIITIAEGIETDDQLRAALACGARMTQGYFHARPGGEALNAAETANLLARFRVATGHEEREVRQPAA